MSIDIIRPYHVENEKYIPFNHSILYCPLGGLHALTSYQFFSQVKINDPSNLEYAQQYISEYHGYKKLNSLPDPDSGRKRPTFRISCYHCKTIFQLTFIDIDPYYQGLKDLKISCPECCRYIGDFIADSKQLVYRDDRYTKKGRIKPEEAVSLYYLSPNPKPDTRFTTLDFVQEKEQLMAFPFKMRDDRCNVNSIVEQIITTEKTENSEEIEVY